MIYGTTTPLDLKFYALDTEGRTVNISLAFSSNGGNADGDYSPINQGDIVTVPIATVYVFGSRIKYTFSGGIIPGQLRFDNSTGSERLTWSNTVWPTNVALIGPTGATGVAGSNGATGPTGATGLFDYTNVPSITRPDPVNSMFINESGAVYVSNLQFSRSGIDSYNFKFKSDGYNTVNFESTGGNIAAFSATDPGSAAYFGLRNISDGNVCYFGLDGVGFFGESAGACMVGTYNDPIIGNPEFIIIGAQQIMYKFMPTYIIPANSNVYIPTLGTNTSGWGGIFVKVLNGSNGVLDVSASMIPTEASRFDLGSTTNVWRNIFTSNLSATNLTVSSAFMTNLSATNLTVSSAVMSNLSATNVTVSNTITIANICGLASSISLAANIVPNVDNTITLGSSTHRFNTIWTSNINLQKQTLNFISDTGEKWGLSVPNGGLSMTKYGDTLTNVIPGAMTSPNVIVAIGNNVNDGSRSSVQVSVDGTAWSVVNVSGVLTNGNDVAFDGGNTWIAVGVSPGSNGVIINSTNGTVWSAVASNVHTNQTLAVCYSAYDSRWYATGYDICGRNVIVRSESGDSKYWTPVCQDISSAFFGNATGLGGNAAAYSIATDGKTTIVAGGWPGDNGSSSILWADTKINGAFWSNAVYSETGSNIKGVISCVAYNGNTWLACADSYIFTSRDGKTWKEAFFTQASTMEEFKALEWNGQYWLAVGYGSVYKSYDGFVWDIFAPSTSGYISCLGWNGTRWTVGGYAIGISTDTMRGLTATSEDWSACTDFSDTTVTNLFSQVNNFANRVLLPNSPPVPGGAIHTSNRPPTSEDGKLGDTWVYSDTNKPTNTYGPKYEVVSYGTHGSVYFGADPTINSVSTASGSSNYNIGTRDYTVNWWMRVPYQQITSTTNAIGTIFKIESENSSITSLGSSLSGDGNVYVTINGTNIFMNAYGSVDQWNFCTLTRSNGTTRFYFNGSNSYTDSEVYNNAYIGNSSNSVILADESTGYLMTNFRWTTGYSDPSAAVVPTQPLSTISGTVLLFNTICGLGMWKDSALNTPMIVPTWTYQGSPPVTYPETTWSGLNPFSGPVDISWGAPRNRQAYQFVGRGVPASDPLGSIPGIGDTYLDLNTGNLYSIDP